jgi:hypothetical protein
MARAPTFFEAVTGAIANAADVSEAAFQRAFGKSRHTPERADEPKARAERLPRDPEARYEQAHWGKAPTRIYDFKSIPGVPDKLVEMGKLCELKCMDDAGPFDIAFARSGHRPILAFDTTDAERLYIALPENLTKRTAAELWDAAQEHEKLAAVANDVGGRQARFAHPDVDVQCVGAVTHVTYYTEKGAFWPGDDEDGKSEYIHEFGEDSGGPVPHLCIDRLGRLWLAGGSYAVPNEGITD